MSHASSRRGSNVSNNQRSSKGRREKTTVNKPQWLLHTVSEFCQQIAVLYEHFAISLQSLVETFQQQANNRDGKIESNSWKKLLEEYSLISEDYFDLANTIEGSTLKEVTNHKEAMLDDFMRYHDNLHHEISLNDSNLVKVEKEYSEAWLKMNRDGRDNIKNHNTALCYNKHNVYVMELAGCNVTAGRIWSTELPAVRKEVDIVQRDLTGLAVQGVVKHAQWTKSKLNDHCQRMDTIINIIEDMKPADVNQTWLDDKKPKDYTFTKPHHNAKGDFLEKKLVLNLATEKTLRDKYDLLLREVTDLEESIAAGKESIAKLHKQHAETQGNQHNRAREILSKLWKQKNELQRNQVCMDGLQAKLDLFTPDILSWKISNGHAKFSSDDQGQVMNKTDQSALSSEAKDSLPDMVNSGPKLHAFQDHNFKKLTFCDNCKGLLKGILKQGVRCKHCKMNVHHKCQDGLEDCKGLQDKTNKVFRRQASVRDIKPTVDKRKLLRRQKSSSELEIPRQYEANFEEVDPIYEAIKCASSLSTGSCLDNSPRPSLVPGGVASVSAQSGSSAGSANSLQPEGRDASMPKSAPHSNV